MGSEEVQAAAAASVRISLATSMGSSGQAKIAAPLPLCDARCTRAILLGASTAEDDMARALGIGARTLRRRLADEGTTLRAVLDGVRLEAAVERLRDPHVSIAGLAIALGFSDPTALARAFRR
jgi:AraC-like DNA-binding protein